MVEPQPDYDIFEGLSKDETNRAMDHSGLHFFDDTDLGRLCASFQDYDYLVNDNIGDGIKEGYNKQHHGARGHTAGTTPAVNSEYNDNMLFDTSSGLAGPHPQAARLLGAAAPDQTTQAPWTHPSAPQPTQPGTFTSLLNTDPTNSNYTQQPPSQPAMQQDPPPPPPPKRRALKAKAPATVKCLRPLARALAAKFPPLKHHIPDPARIKRTQIKALLKHLLGGCDSPNPLPYPEASDFEGPHNPDQEPYYYLARLFSELLGKDISAEDMKECVERTSGNPWLVADEHLRRHGIYTASYTLPLTREACRAAGPPAELAQQGNDDGREQSGSGRAVRRAAAGRARGRGTKPAAKGRQAGSVQQAVQAAAPGGGALGGAQQAAQRTVYVLVPVAAGASAPAAAQVPPPSPAAGAPPAAVWPAERQAAVTAPAPAPAAELAPSSSGATSGSKRSRDQLSDDSSFESADEEQQEQEEPEDGICSKKQRISCQVSVKQEKQQRKTLAVTADAADAAAALGSADVRPLISMSQQEMAASVAEQVRLMLLMDSGAEEFKQCLQRFSGSLLPSLSRDHLAAVIEVLSACHALTVQEGWGREEEEGSLRLG